jgi:predicted dehydrogenase
MEQTKILLIGAGQLGSRHLQALASLGRPASIQVVDPSAASLNVARARWDEVGGHDGIEFRPELGSAGTGVDVAIVATNADVRRRVVERLLALARPKYVILEKVVFQHSDDFAAVAGLFTDRGVTAWVNCPRRMWPVYQELRSSAKFPISLEVTGSNWGLACNAIHFLDLFAYLSGAREADIEPRLDRGLIKSKRAGFIELTGSLTAHFGNAGRAVLTSRAAGSDPVIIKVEDKRNTWELQEGKGTLTLTRIPEGEKAERSFEVLFQSKLTNRVVEQLLRDGDCQLTPYEESRALHVPLLQVISEHLHGPGKVKPCPIT